MAGLACWDGMAWAHGSGLGYWATRLGLMGLAPGLGWKQSLQEVIDSRSSDSRSLTVSHCKSHSQEVVIDSRSIPPPALLAKARGNNQKLSQSLVSSFIRSRVYSYTS